MWLVLLRGNPRYAKDVIKEPIIETREICATIRHGPWEYADGRITVDVYVVNEANEKNEVAAADFMSVDTVLDPQ